MVMKAAVTGRSDPVIADDLPDPEWYELRTEHHRVRHRAKNSLCSCVDCGHPVHPKQVRDTRFFAHNPDPANPCPLKILEAGESPDHRHLKLSIFKAVRREPGWEAEIESSSPESDPVTKKPVVIDVVARRRARQAAASWTPRVQGWEVQLGPMDRGKAEERQEFRRRWLGLCTWVTRSDRRSWADTVPWYQVRKAGEEGPELVVDGVTRWSPRLGAYVNEGPFPADLMVGYMLRGALWADGHWMLDYVAEPRSHKRLPRSEPTKALVAEYCDRANRIPEEARGWTGEDWARYAPMAYYRRQAGEQLTPLDHMAIARCPGFEIDRQAELAQMYPADHVLDNRPRCVHCDQVVSISVEADYALHHHCAWHLQRGTRCRWCG